MKRATKLPTFVQKECANFIRGACIDSTKCKVLSKQPCNYFERAVLGQPNYKFQLPDYDYFKLFEQYAEIQTALQGRIVSQRLCPDCEINALLPRKRYCDDCRKERQLKSNRLGQQRRRRP